MLKSLATIQNVIINSGQWVSTGNEVDWTFSLFLRGMLMAPCFPMTALRSFQNVNGLKRREMEFFC